MATGAAPALALPPLGLVIDAGSGLLLVALAAWVLTLRPRRRVNLALAAFAAVYGVAFVVTNLMDLWFTPQGVELDPAPPILAAYAVFFGAASAAVVALGLAFPRPLPAARLAAWPALFAGGYLLAALVLPGAPVSFLVHNPVLLLRGASFFTMALLAARAASAQGPGAARERRQCALLAGALALYPGMLTGAEFFLLPLGRPISVVSLAAFGVLAAGWLAVAARAPPGEGRAPRDAALLTLGAPLAGMVVTLLVGGFDAAITQGPMGLSRTLAVLLIAWGILRQQLLDIDVKVKRTLRQSTVAAAFVGVFFVVSESASQFFAADVSLGPYLGIVAAGLLVFALAPVQHLAERLANAALPGVEASPAYLEFKRFDLYRTALANALRDGVVTADERAILEGLRVQLGLSPTDAQALERELAPAAAPARPRGRR